MESEDVSKFLTTIVQDGNLQSLESLLNVKALHHSPDSLEDSSILDAVNTGLQEVAKLLLENGCTLDKDNQWTTTPLHIAVQKGDLEWVDLLLSANFNVNARRKNNITPLHDAVFSENIEMVKLLLDKGAKINSKMEFGSGTPLFHAVKKNNLEIVKILLDKGAEINVRNEDKEHILFLAIENNQVDIVQQLLRYGANVQMTECKNGFTPLHLAASLGNEKIVKVLLNYFANPDSTANNNLTPLLCASQNNQQRVVEILSNLEIHVNYEELPDLDEKCVGRYLSSAVREGNLHVVKCLLNKYNLSYCIHWVMGFDLLLSAVKNQHVEIVKLLVAKGSKLDKGAKRTVTPLHEAVNRKNKEIIDILLAANANVNSKRENGNTPVVDAIANNSIEIVKLFLEKGKNFDSTNKNLLKKSVIIHSESEIEQLLSKHGVD